MTDSAIILAGGFGTRLKTVVAHLPKPMAPVNGVPFLNYQLNYLKSFGIKKVVFSVGYLSEKINAYYGNSYRDLEISYALEHQPLGTGGGIRLALEKISSTDAFVFNGDSFFDVDLKKFHDLHTSQKGDAAIALRKVADASRYGAIECDKQNHITSFTEKSTQVRNGTINGGVYILEKKAYLENTPEVTSFSIENDYFAKCMHSLNILGFEFDGYFIDIGVPTDYLRAQDEFKGFKYQ